MKRLALLLFILACLWASPSHAQCTVKSTLLNVGDCINITVQPAEWPQNWSPTIPGPTGTRINAPVTFGLPIPDLAQISCPNTTGNWSLPDIGYGFPPNQEPPTQLQLQGVSGTPLSAQMRCMSVWPDGWAKDVLFDAQIPSFTEQTPGTQGPCSSGFCDASIYVVKVASGGGNLAPGAIANMAGACTGTNTPYTGCTTGDLYVNTTAALFTFKKQGYNLFDSVIVGSTPIISAAIHDTNTDGLYLSGPTYSAVAAIGSVSCLPAPYTNGGSITPSGPIPVSYSGSNVCGAAGGGADYTSQNDNTASTSVPCSTLISLVSCWEIEENGPLRAVILEQGQFQDSSHHWYGHLTWRTRTTCWYGHTSCEVTTALINADASCGAPSSSAQNICNAGKMYGALEERLTDGLSGSSRNFSMGSHLSATPTACTLTATQSCYLFGGSFLDGTWAHYDDQGSNNCQFESTVCLVSPVARSGKPSTQQYALQGYQTAGLGVGIGNGNRNDNPIGYADFDNGTNGIEIGVYQFHMDWPKSLEAQAGISGHNQIRIGIKPNQDEWLNTGGSYVINPSYVTGGPFGTTGCTVTPCSQIVSYVMPYLQYDITKTFWDFHTGTAASRVTQAQNDFLYYQHPMIARATAGCAYYNSATDAATGIPAFFYQCPDPVQQDQYYKNIQGFSGSISSGICGSAAAGSCVGDVNTASFPFGQGPPTQGNEYPGMKNFNYYIWWLAGGNDGTQFEERWSMTGKWLQRGCTPVSGVCGGASTVGSVPGHYIYADQFYRMVTEKTLPRSDGVATFGASAGWRQYCSGVSTCTVGGAYDKMGDPRPQGVLSQPTSLWNEGQSNMGDVLDGGDHNTYWGMILFYFLSGNEWMHEQLLQGFKDRYENMWVAYNNLDSPNQGGAGYGQPVSPRERAHMFSNVARTADFLISTRDPEMDTPTTVATSPGPTAMAAGIQAVTSDFFPLVSGGYPKGWAEASGSALGGYSCQTPNSALNIILCGQGTSIFGFYRPSHGGEEPAISATTVPALWQKSHPYTVQTPIIDNHQPDYGWTWVVTACVSSCTSGAAQPAFKSNETPGTTLTDNQVTWTNQGIAPGPAVGTGNFVRQYNNFMLGSSGEGLYDLYLEARKIMGRDWHLIIGAGNTKSPLAYLPGGNQVTGGNGYMFNGGTTIPGDNVVVSEAGLKDRMYAAGVWEGLACEDPAHDPTKTWSYGNLNGANSTGCPYNSDLDYIAALATCGPSGIQPCQSGISAGTVIGGALGPGMSLRNCVNLCSGQQMFFGIDAVHPWTNSTNDLNGNTWQFIGSTMEQNQGTYHDLANHETSYMDYWIISNGNTNVNPCTPSTPCSNSAFQPGGSYPLTMIAPTIALGTATGTINNTSSSTCGVSGTLPCPPGVVVTGNGTVTISFPQQTGICSVGINCPPFNAPNGHDIVLKYYTCKTSASGFITQAGQNTFGTDCPTGGKIIVPDLGFSSDTTNCNGQTPCVVVQSNIPGASTCSGSNTAPPSFNAPNSNCWNVVGSAHFDPASYQPWFQTITLPDCGNGYSYTGCNSAATTAVAMNCSSGTCSYTMNVVSGQTYTFWAGAYEAGNPSLNPTSYSFLSAAIGTSSADSSTFTFTNPTASALTGFSIVASTNFTVTSTTCGSTVAAGANCTATVRFVPTATGSLSGTLTAAWTGGGAGSPLTASLAGTGLASGQVCIIPPIIGAGCNGTYTFTPSNIGTPSIDSPAQETLSNTSGAGLTSVACSTTGTNASDFTLTGSCPGTLANNAIYNAPVTFTPGAPGSRSGNLQVAYGGGGGGSGPTATTCNQSDVATAIASATEGQTVTIPAGNCTWTSGITVSGKGVAIQGAGSGRIIAIDNNTEVLTVATGTLTVNIGMYSPGFSASSITTGETLRIAQTNYNTNWMQGTVTSLSGSVLTMNITSTGGGASASKQRWYISTIPQTVITDNSSSVLFTLNENTGFNTSLSGIKIIPATVGNYYVQLNYTAGGQPILIHDTWMVPTSFEAINSGTDRGVVWHNTCEGNTASDNLDNVACLRIVIDSPATGVNDAWSHTGYWGMLDTTGTNNLYYEGNDVHAMISASDNDSNGRLVWRYNLMDSAAFGTHGADSSIYGERYFEFYNNTGNYAALSNGFSFNLANGWVGLIRGGTFVIHDNNLPVIAGSDYASNDIHGLVMNLQRNVGASPCWGSNYSSPGQYYYAPRQLGIGYVTGTGTTNFPPDGCTHCTTDSSGIYVGDLEPGYIWNNNRTLSVSISDYGTAFVSVMGSGGGSGAQVAITGESGGVLSGLSIVSGGAGYSGTISCSISGAGGSGATCTATQSGGVINSVTLTSGGSGYTSAQACFGAYYDHSSDYINNAQTNYFNGSTAKPGYTPYTYPHPLTNSGGAGSVSAPLSGTGLGGIVTVTPGSLNFADTVVGLVSTDSPQNVTINNGTSGAITITSVSVGTANFSDANLCGTVASLGSCTVQATFNPLVIGSLMDTLTIVYTGAAGSPQTVSLSGNGIAPIPPPTLIAPSPQSIVENIMNGVLYGD